MLGNVVRYRAGDTEELAKVIDARDSKTYATIRLLTGKQRGQELEAPWGVIESERKTNLSYSGTFIEVIVRPQEDCTFTSGGLIRKPDQGGTGLPLQTRFEMNEHFLTEDAARESALSYTKEKIDSFQER